METRSGIVTYIQKRKFYGFIQDIETSERVFFHGTGVCEGNLEDMRAGMEVEYMEAEAPTGKAAIGVVLTR